MGDTAPSQPRASDFKHKEHRIRVARCPYFRKVCSISRHVFSRKIKARFYWLFNGNPQVTDIFHLQSASNAESVSMSWLNHVRFEDNWVQDIENVLDFTKEWFRVFLFMPRPDGLLLTSPSISPLVSRQSCHYDIKHNQPIMLLSSRPITGLYANGYYVHCEPIARFVVN